MAEPGERGRKVRAAGPAAEPPKRTGGPLARRNGGRPAARIPAPCREFKRAYRRGPDIGHQRFAGI